MEGLPGRRGVGDLPQGIVYDTSMSPHDLDSVVELFARLDVIETETWAYLLEEEISRLEAATRRRNLQQFFEERPADLVEQLRRPRRPDPDWLEKNRAVTVGSRTVYAVQAVKVGDEPMAMVYADDFVKKHEGMRNRFAVAEVDGALKIVARHVMCGSCKGTGVEVLTTADCPYCKAQEQGWRFAGGRELKKPKPEGEVLRLVEPTRDYDKSFYLDVLE